MITEGDQGVIPLPKHLKEKSGIHNWPVQVRAKSGSRLILDALDEDFQPTGTMISSKHHANDFQSGISLFYFLPFSHQYSFIEVLYLNQLR